MMTVARRIRVSGRVQGVWFRAWTQQQARALGVSGWVRNCEDGSVEAHVEGDGAPLEELVTRMGTGPSGARVDRVEVTEAAPEEMAGFEVRH